MIEDVFEKPARHERLIKQRMNPNDAIFFLNRTEDEIFARPLFPTPAPNNAVTTQLPAKMSFLYALENSAQIKTAAFMLQIEMALHRQHRPRKFSFCLFPSHLECPESVGVYLSI